MQPIEEQGHTGVATAAALQIGLTIENIANSNYWGGAILTESNTLIMFYVRGEVQIPKLCL